MKKRIKKVGCIFLSAVLLLIFSVHSSAQEAAVYNTYPALQCWHSTDGKIGYWDSPIKLYCSSYLTHTGLTTSDLQSYANTARSAWSRLGLNFSIVSNQATANIVLCAILPSQAESYGISPYLSGYADLVANDADDSDYNMTAVDIGNYQGASKIIYRIHGLVYVYLIYDSSDIDVDPDGLKRHRVAIHELSHAFGYMGHYPSSGRLMSSTAAGAPNTGALTSYEVNHLLQIYNLYT